MKEYFNSEPQENYRSGIHLLPEILQEVIDSNCEYEQFRLYAMLTLIHPLLKLVENLPLSNTKNINVVTIRVLKALKIWRALLRIR